MPLAHPVIRHIGLGLSAVTVAVVAALVVLAVGTVLPRPRESRKDASAQIESWIGALTTSQIVTRGFSVALLALAVSAARTGSESQLRNIAPALVIGAGWPLLLFGSATLGPIWRWIDPWDALARIFGRERTNDRTDPAIEAPGAASVWPALLPALGWTWYLSAYTGTLDPRPLGSALAAYSLFTVGACLALGRTRWLSRGEVFGLLFSWTSRLPRGRLVSWDPPQGAEALLGVVAGGVLFGLLRQTTLWGELNVARLASLYSAAGLLACSALGGLVLFLLARLSSRVGAPGAVAAASVAAVASTALAVAMVRNRLFTSLQLLPRLASDPFGFGRDLFGTADWTLDPDPLGRVGLWVAEMVVLAAGHVAGAVILARRVKPSARNPALLGLSTLMAGSVLAITSIP